MSICCCCGSTFFFFFFQCLPERFTGNLVDTRDVHWDRDPAECNNKAAREEDFFFHTGVSEHSYEARGTNKDHAA